jgi:hypothetical protein
MLILLDLIKMPYVPVYAGKCTFRAYEYLRRIYFVGGSTCSVFVFITCRGTAMPCPYSRWVKYSGAHIDMLLEIIT